MRLTCAERDGTTLVEVVQKIGYPLANVPARIHALSLNIKSGGINLET
jgi:hypothetical protein